MKKLLLTIGTASAIIAPMATVVACGSETPTTEEQKTEVNSQEILDGMIPSFTGIETNGGIVLSGSVPEGVEIKLSLDGGSWVDGITSGLSNGDKVTIKTEVTGEDLVEVSETNSRVIEVVGLTDTPIVINEIKMDFVNDTENAVQTYFDTFHPTTAVMNSGMNDLDITYNGGSARTIVSDEKILDIVNAADVVLQGLVEAPLSVLDELLWADSTSPTGPSFRIGEDQVDDVENNDADRLNWLLDTVMQGNKPDDMRIDSTTYHGVFGLRDYIKVHYTQISSGTSEEINLYLTEEDTAAEAKLINANKISIEYITFIKSIEKDVLDVLAKISELVSVINEIINTTEEEVRNMIIETTAAIVFEKANEYPTFAALLAAPIIGPLLENIMYEYIIFPFANEVGDQVCAILFP